MQVKCPVCGKNGTLTEKTTITKTKTKKFKYTYYYIQHKQVIEGRQKTVWHYLGKFEDLPREVQDAIHKEAKTIHKDKNPKLSSKTEIEWRGCPSLVGGRPAKPVVRLGRAGSNPAPRANRILQNRNCLISLLHPF